MATLPEIVLPEIREGGIRKVPAEDIPRWEPPQSADPLRVAQMLCARLAEIRLQVFPLLPGADEREKYDHPLFTLINDTLKAARKDVGWDMERFTLECRITSQRAEIRRLHKQLQAQKNERKEG